MKSLRVVLIEAPLLQLAVAGFAFPLRLFGDGASSPAGGRISACPCFKSRLKVEADGMSVPKENSLLIIAV